MKMKFTLSLINNSVIKFILLGLVALVCSIANAGSTNFYCSGVMKGEGISDSPYDFDLLVDSSTGYMAGFPDGLALGCFQINALKIMGLEEFKPMKCLIDDTAATCYCDNYKITKKFTFSRRSAILIVNGYINVNEPISGDRITRGRFACQKLKNKAF